MYALPPYRPVQVLSHWIAEELSEELSSASKDGPLAKANALYGRPEYVDAHRAASNFVRDCNCAAARYLDTFLQQVDRLFVSSPEGLVIEIAKQLVLPNKTLNSVTNVEQYFSKRARYYEVVDTQLWVIDKKKYIAFLEDESVTLLSSITIQTEFLDLIEKFDRWSLCVREQDFPDSIGKVFQLDISPTDGRGGRPRLQEDAGAAYREVFPQGHKAAGRTWKQAVIKVSEYVGHNRFKEDTIKRALGLKK